MAALPEVLRPHAAFLRRAEEYFGLPADAVVYVLDRSTPDIAAIPATRTVLIGRRWQRASGPEQRKRLVHELAHIAAGLQHNDAARALGYYSNPRRDRWSRAVYDDIIAGAPHFEPARFGLAPTEDTMPNPRRKRVTLDDLPFSERLRSLLADARDDQDWGRQAALMAIEWVITTGRAPLDMERRLTAMPVATLRVLVERMAADGVTTVAEGKDWLWAWMYPKRNPGGMLTKALIGGIGAGAGFVVGSTAVTEVVRRLPGVGQTGGSTVQNPTRNRKRSRSNPFEEGELVTLSALNTLATVMERIGGGLLDAPKYRIEYEGARGRRQTVVVPERALKRLNPRTPTPTLPCLECRRPIRIPARVQMVECGNCGARHRVNR